MARNRAPGGGLLDAELDIEDLARTVTCPCCGAEPGEACVYRGLQGPLRRQTASQYGRLLAARRAS